jgi:hypothetical protein
MFIFIRQLLLIKTATLSDLKVDGVTVAGFAADKLNYSVVLREQQLYLRLQQ